MAEQQEGARRFDGGGESTAQQVGKEAQQRAQQIGDQVRDTASDMMGRAQQQAESGKDQAADQMDKASEAIRQAARQMEDQQAWMAGLVERGADELARFADTLRQNDLRSLLQSAEDFARRQPMLFAGGAFALGFAAMRATRAGLSAAAPRAADAMRDAAQSVRDTTASVTNTVQTGTGSRPGNGSYNPANPLRTNGSEARETAR